MDNGRTNISSGSPWEPVVGYSRAVRVGNQIFVAGTTGVDADGKPVSGGVYGQTKRALEIIIAALEQAGASPRDVVRTRIFVTDIAHWQEAGRAHAEVFADVRPALTMVEASRLVDVGMLVEVEADAIVSS